ncbi:hypothetical protein ElyMa_000618800 [Elysia marginata]|uniref:ABC transmembrane type-1 domain-containing protein n=1 Tax=Elysia marginata TaxID=1093978 RepID=A0AAV4G9H7_9GAST|nr:hypothetical protein ElyMa_000618800 [Elysia marginata]
MLGRYVEILLLLVVVVIVVVVVVVVVVAAVVVAVAISSFTLLFLFLTINNAFRTPSLGFRLWWLEWIAGQETRPCRPDRLDASTACTGKIQRTLTGPWPRHRLALLNNGLAQRTIPRADKSENICGR